jgi:hypothetical protein
VNTLRVRVIAGILLGTALSFGSVTVAMASATVLRAPVVKTAYQSVPLSQATVARTTFYVAPPASLTTAGGVPFTLGNAYWMHFGDPAATLTMNVATPQAVYLLINTSWTDAAFAGQTVGTVRLTFSDGTFRDTALVVSSNIREWEYGVSWAANTLSSPSTVSVWLGQGQASQAGAAATIDMLTIPAVSKAHLTGVTVTDTNSGHLGIVFQGLTVAYDPDQKHSKGKFSGGEDEHETADHHDGQGDSHSDTHAGQGSNSHDGHDGNNGHGHDGHEE